MEEACRLRYDRLLFASERCSKGTLSTGTEARTRRVLELGAMTLLEAEMENMFQDHEVRRDPQKLGYASCLEEMLDRHYNILGKLFSILLA